MMIPILIGIIILGYGVMELICKDADNSHYDGKCKGTLLSIRDIKTLDPTGDYKQKALRFRYKVGHRIYEEVHIQGDSDYTMYIIGRTYPLRYHTEKPEDIMVDVQTEPMLLYYISIVAGISLIILAMAGVISV